MVAKRASKKTKKKATKTNGKATATAVAEKPATRGRGRTAKKPEEKKYEIIRPQWVMVVFEILGLTPLITHRFGETPIKKIEDKQQSNVVKKRQPRVPSKEYLESLYLVPGNQKWKDTKNGKYGIAGHSFKQSCVGAARYVDGLNMTYTRGCFFVADEVVAIGNMSPYMRTDVVRLPNGSADIRYRGCFRAGWTAKVHMEIDVSIIDPGSVFNLFYRAGTSVGVGDWRPACNGNFGRFTVLSMKEVKQPKTRKKRA